MKKFLFLLSIVFVFLFAEVKSNDQKPQMSLEKYDIIFEQISKKRVGPSDEELSRVPTPFVGQDIFNIIRDKNATKPKSIVLRLYGIMNDRAKINKKWYKLNSKVYGYRLVEIKNISVILKRKRKKLELFLRKKNDKIKITNNF